MLGKELEALRVSPIELARQPSDLPVRGRGMTAGWKDIDEPDNSPCNEVTLAQVVHGPSIPPQQRLLTYSSEQWEDFVHEWVHYCLKKSYKQVQRFSGAGDMGIDVVGFQDDQRLKGVWDNYQCKHYDHALMPTDVWSEFGKVIWYSFKGEYTAPHRYYFVSPWGAGTKLSRLLGNAMKLREELIANWDKNVRASITSIQDVPLDGALRTYLDAFNFSIFKAKTALELVDDHRSTPVHAARFGGGLPVRPAAATPPALVAPAESRYVTQLLGAYTEHTGASVHDPSALPTGKLREHF